MKALLIVFGLLCCAVCGAQSVANHAENASGTSGAGFSFSLTNANDFVIICVSTGADGTETFTAAVTVPAETMTQVGSGFHNAGAAISAGCFTGKWTTGGAHTVTLTSSFADGIKYQIWELTGMGSTLTVDGSASAGAATANPDSGAITTTATDAILGYVAGAAASYTAGAGFTITPASCGSNFCGETKFSVASGTPHATFTASAGNYLAVGIAIKQAAAAVVRHRALVIQ